MLGNNGEQILKIIQSRFGSKISEEYYFQKNRYKNLFPLMSNLEFESIIRRTDFICKRRVAASEVLLDAADVDGVPRDDGVGEQVQAQGLGVLFMLVAFANFASVGVEDVLA